jgi:hypothetical protein
MNDLRDAMDTTIRDWLDDHEQSPWDLVESILLDIRLKGYVLVKRDDLRKAIDDIEYAFSLYDSGDCGNLPPNDRSALDRLTAALGIEETP